MNDIAVSTLANNITTTGIYTPYGIQYDPCNYTITASTYCPPIAKLESDSNELKINIKKFQIKFNFNL